MKKILLSIVLLATTATQARAWDERTAGEDANASDDIEWAALLRLVDKLYPDYRN